MCVNKSHTSILTIIYYTKLQYNTNFISFIGLLAVCASRLTYLNRKTGIAGFALKPSKPIVIYKYIIKLLVLLR